MAGAAGRLTLLVFYHRLAGWLLRARHLLWAVALASALGFVWLLVTGTDGRSSAWLMLAALTLLWTLSLAFVAVSFARPAPEVEPGDRFFRRAGKRLRRLARWLVALWATALSAALVWFTLRAVRIAIAELG